MNKNSCYRLCICASCGSIFDVVMAHQMRCFCYGAGPVGGTELMPLSTYVRTGMKLQKRELIPRVFKLVRAEKPHALRYEPEEERN
jgi:hypothetical protein